MCGRYVQTLPAEAMRRLFKAGGALPNLSPNYNAAPTQRLPVCRFNPETGERSLDVLRWGLVPSWAKDLSIGARTINARAEGVAEKPSFRSAFKARRCLVPADYFYEWKKEGSAKQPFRIGRADGPPLVFAGLWEGWQDKQSQEWVRTFTIITTTPSAQMAALHDRMPVILEEEHWPAWLGEEKAEPASLLPLLAPWPGELELVAVSKDVGNVANNRPDLIDAV
ncbi:SOS response-associated peptidase [Radicibacter daui]|uniref:SOS response-associated peptidase n=1 Tax=Radicibacter daui TaxID=3064829 RepID=UPI004046E93D